MKVEIKKLLFGPNDNIEKFVIEEINKAKKEINIMVFWFTWKPIADALLRALARGVNINLILDSRSTEKKIQDVDVEKELIVPKYLLENGFKREKIKIYNGELLHHKIILFDDENVLMGSCNFFNGSIKRHEEHYMLAISDELYDTFYNKFKELWTQNSSVYDSF